MQKAIGYIRVSTQGQADEGVSLAAQRAKIEAWCSLNDAELVAVFEDAGISGASMNGREGLHAALKATTKGMALVTYSISRLARSTKDLLEIGLNVKSLAPAERLRALPAGGMCQYAVRIAATAELDPQLRQWLKVAYDAAG